MKHDRSLPHLAVTSRAFGQNCLCHPHQVSSEVTFLSEAGWCLDYCYFRPSALLDGIQGAITYSEVCPPENSIFVPQRISIYSISSVVIIYVVCSYIFRNMFGSKFFSLITNISVPILFPPFCFPTNLRILSVFPFGEHKSIT